MNHTTLVKHLAGALALGNAEVEDMLGALVTTVRQAALEGNSVAVPSFGTWAAVKSDETIVTDRVSGRRMMLPPAINLEFTPAAMLKKQISRHE